MKKMMIAIALSSLVTTLAQAATGVLLEERSYGGMPMPGGEFYSSSVQVTDQGLIQIPGRDGKVTVVATLSKSALEILKTKIANLKEEALPAPEGDACADAPSTSITVTKPDGKAVVISQTDSCRPSVMPGAYSLINIAKDVSGLAFALSR